MTFPFSFYETFEGGNKGAFDSESDSGNRLDFPGPDQLAKGLMDVFPHRGAYCMRVNLGKNATDAYLTEGVSWAADSTNHVAFKFMVGEDVQIGNDGDSVGIMRLWNGSANEGFVSLARIEPAGMVLGVNDGGSTLNYLKVEPGDWLCVEAQIDVDAGGGNDGSIIVRVGDDQIRLSNLDQGAITVVDFGAIGQSGDFKGHIYFDEIQIDTARLHQDYGPHNLKLDGETFPLFKSGWVFVGEGSVMGLELVDGGSNDCVMKVYDTAELSFSEAMKKGHLATASGHPVDRVQALGDTPLINFDYGCYVALSGTNPSAFVRIGRVDSVFEDDEDEGEDGDEG